MAQTMSVAAPFATENENQKPAEGAAHTFHELVFSVDNMHCGGCMRAVEQALCKRNGVRHARVNLSEQRAIVHARTTADPEDLITALKDAGFSASLLADPSNTNSDDVASDLMRRLGVAGFATMNVMLLSVSVWSGGDGDMDESARSLFHWLSALIALPAIAYSGQPFFKSARTALAGWHVNMDVPISLGVLLATAMSVYQTATQNGHVYFDAALMLLTFLLLGRLLDQLMRARASSAAENLLKLRQPMVRIVDADGTPRRIPIGNVVPKMSILVAAGERFAVDGRILEGTSSIDQSIITGETLPVAANVGDFVFSGALNLGNPLKVEVTAREDQSLLSEIASLMRTAEQQRGRYVQIADRAARLYAPAVHTLAGLTFIGWLAMGLGWQEALPIAIAVLIVTCPCALALAVPAVQVAAAGRLLKRGIVMKSGDALERLAQCDTFVFDKTGTLTTGEISLANGSEISDDHLAKAASLAANSTHPYSEAIVEAANARGIIVSPIKGVEESAGFGMTTGEGQDAYRLGSAAWCDVKTSHGAPSTENVGNVYVRYPGGNLIVFNFRDRLKDDAPSVIKTLKNKGHAVELLSGDTQSVVRDVAIKTGISTYTGGVSPAEKVKHLDVLKASNHVVAMIGDGLNDAPSLKAAHVSLSPASAAHITQSAADFVIQGNRLDSVTFAIDTAQRASSLVRQNFALAIAYNIVFVPLAIAGLVTPLIAAIAMSLSSISVTANAIRLHATGEQV